MPEQKNVSQMKQAGNPAEDALFYGPIPPDELAFLDMVEPYLDLGLVDEILDIHFMLEKLCWQGVPGWWNGSTEEFQAEFRRRYLNAVSKLDNHLPHLNEIILRAAQEEVEAGRLDPLPEDSTSEQWNAFFICGKQRLQQIFALEVLLNMWVEARNL